MVYSSPLVKSESESKIWMPLHKRKKKGCEKFYYAYNLIVIDSHLYFLYFFPLYPVFFFSLLNYIEKFENKTSQLYKHMAVIPICTIFNFFLSNEKTIGIDHTETIYTLHWRHWDIDIYMNTSFHLINQHTEKKITWWKKSSQKMAEVSHMTLTTCTNHKSR